jgi:hypothetical protein
MYDTTSQRWEIIDGFAKESNDTNYTSQQFLKDLMRKATLNDATRQMLADLSENASSKINPYDRETDILFLEKVSGIHFPKNAGLAA